jgi:chorismate mutase
MVTKAVRGATGVGENTARAVRTGVERMMGALLERNGLSEEELISVQFTITADLTALNPAAAFRAMGYDTVPLFCAQEPQIDGMMGRVIRVLVTFRADESARPVPVYIDGAERLRPDLAEEG